MPGRRLCRLTCAAAGSSPETNSLQPTKLSLMNSAFFGMARWSRTRWLVTVIAVPMLAACGGKERVCSDETAPYVGARNNAPLQVPEGLSLPSRSGALTIPDVGQDVQKSERTGCLDEPPSYFRSAGTVARTPEEVVASWAQAWSTRDAEGVIALYSAKFQAPTDASSAAAWLEQRREQVAVGPVPDAALEELQVIPDGADRRIVRFVQKFGANSLRKELVLVREGISWRIIEEKVSAVK
jgi:hypothetical protein